MEVSKVLAYAASCIDEFDLLGHPFYKAWSRGELTHGDLREYAVAYYPHVAAFPTYLSALHSRLPDGYLRRAVLRNLWEEELDGQPHAEMWLDFAEGLGAKRKAIQDSRPRSHIQELINTFRYLAGSPGSALAAFYVYESQMPQVAKEKAKTLRNFYGADDVTCRYFDVHVEADRDHAHVWKEQLKRILTEEPKRAEEVRTGARAAAQSLWRALDGIEETRVVGLR